jgi:two-component system NarL family sensor kinase
MSAQIVPVRESPIPPRGPVAAPGGPAVATDATPAARVSYSPQVDTVAMEHSYRGMRLQLLLRGVLVAFVVLTFVFFPPRHDRLVCDVIVVLYAVWAALVALRTLRRGPAPLRLVWLDLSIDLAALGALTLLAGASAQQSWTVDVLVNGFFLVPVLAATQLRPEVSAIIVGPTIVVYFVSSAVTRGANDLEPWGSILLRTMVLAGVGVGCIVLSYIQRSRVATISRLAQVRTDLLSELATIEARERRELAESLHDGALQYVLAARHDLEDARELSDQEAFARLDRALTESSRLLRSTVAELHPAVLEQAGLARALGELVRNAEASGGFSAVLDVDGWSEDLRTPVDGLIYATARELLSNVVKHSHAETVRISLADQNDELARLVIVDDGRGITEDAVKQSLKSGHIGLASYRVRVEAAGGSLTLSRAWPSGTRAEVTVPHAT